MISKQQIFVLWVLMQTGSVISLWFDVRIETALDSFFFSGVFMMLLLIVPKDAE